MIFIFKSGNPGLGYFKQKLLSVLIKKCFYKKINIYRGGLGGGINFILSKVFFYLFPSNGGRSFICKNGLDGFNGILYYSIICLFFIKYFFVFIINNSLVLRPSYGGKFSNMDFIFSFGEKTQLIVFNILKNIRIFYIFYVIIIINYLI